MRNNLIPTAIVDKNGKPTTVHKRGAQASPSANRLGALKPSLGTVKKKDKPSKVSYSLDVIHSESFFHQTGLTGAAKQQVAKVGTGTVMVPNDVLYGFLKVGITVQEAGLLVDMGYPNAESLMDDPDLAKGLPGQLVRTRRWGGDQVEDRSIEKVVDFLAEGGVSPQKIAKAVANNLDDSMLVHNVLIPEQLADLFTRFTYNVSKNEEKGTGSSRLFNAIIDGRMPFSVSEKQHGVERPVSSNLHDALYLSDKRNRAKMTDDLRQRLKTDQQLLLRVGQVMSKNRNHIRGGYQQTVDAIDKYGYEAAVEYGPELLDARMSDGTPLGIDGAEEAREMLGYLKKAIGDGSKDQYSVRNGSSLSGTGNSYHLYSAPMGIPATNVYASDLVEMKRSGVAVEDILPYMKQGLDTNRIIAVTTGGVPKSVATGWL